MATKPKISPVMRSHALRLMQEETGGKIRRGKLFPIAAALTSMIEQPVEAVALSRRSYIAQVAAQQEAGVVEALRKEGLDCYCPFEPKSVRVNAMKRRTINKPMMPGYVFPIFDEHRDNWQIIQPEREGRGGIKGVIRLFVVSERPVPVPDAAIQQIHDREIEAMMRGKGRSPVLIPFQVGKFVQIDDYGPWHGFIGEVLEVIAPRARIKVGIDVFGRQTPVEVSVNQVRAV